MKVGRKKKIQPEISPVELNEKRLKKSIGKRLRKLRLERGYTVNTVAHASGICPSTLSKIEYGQMTLPITRLVKLLSVLDCTMGDVLKNAESK